MFLPLFFSKLASIQLFRIDNINAVCKWNTGLNLHWLSNSLTNCRFNPERFPAIFFQDSAKLGTVLIFESGKLSITGVKSVDNLNVLWLLINQLITANI